MKIAISQSNYLPWKGYFDLIQHVDEFIFFDEVQFTRRDWRNRNIIRKSLVASVFIKKGQKFQKNNILSKRPGGGISPMAIKKILGKKAKKNFSPEEMIKI